MRRPYDSTKSHSTPSFNRRTRAQRRYVPPLAQSDHHRRTRDELACDVGLGTLERLETAWGGKDLSLWIEPWLRIEGPSGNLSPSICRFSLTAARVEWLRYLGGVGYRTYELMELRASKENADPTHRSIDRIREAQHRLSLGDHGAALAAARKLIQALGSMAPQKSLEALFSGYHPTHATADAGIASKPKQIPGRELSRGHLARHGKPARQRIRRRRPHVAAAPSCLRPSTSADACRSTQDRTVATSGLIP